MRTLTDIFTPGAPALPEGLRTLAVSPDRELEPGVTLRATFTFRNQGGAVASGVRVRFNLPEGLVYLVGSGTLDGRLLDDEHGSSPLLSRAGAEVGDVDPGDERRIDISYSVAGAIENGSTVELQAAVSAFELAPVGSNVVRLVARSRPALQNAMTGVTIESRQHEPRAGGEATITIRIHNAGESSAHDVVVAAPVPEHTTYVANSARVNGREFERDLLAPFDGTYAPVVAAALPASATVTLQYRVRILQPLPDGTSIAARASVASQETQAFELGEALLTVSARADFDDDRSGFAVEPAQDVLPGTRASLKLRLHNAGTASARDVSAAFEFPEGLLAVRGTVRLDGFPLRERKGSGGVFEIGTIAAGESVLFEADAVVASPLADARVLRAAAVVQWNVDGGTERAERRFEHDIAIRSKPFLAARRNKLARAGSAAVHPADEIEAEIAIVNDGSAAAHDTVLEFTADPMLDDVRVFEKNVRLPLENGAVELGTLEAFTSRALTVRGRVRTPCPDRTGVCLQASLHTQELGETPLGEAQWNVESHPAFSSATSQLSLVQDDVFRPNQLVDVFVRLRNEGTDVAHNVRLRLYISPEARLENVDGATRERSTLGFGEIAPGATVEARLSVRLLRSLAKSRPVTIEAVATADALLPVQLAPLAIVTTAEPNFAIGTLRSVPQDVADAGDEVEFVLHVRNSGDGPAVHARIAVDPLESLIYLPNSTTVNDIGVRDSGSLSPLMSERGLVLTDVDPGVEATIRWREVVKTTVGSGTVVDRIATVAYDGERKDEIAAPALDIRCAPAFANSISGLPFGLDGLPGPAFGGPRALTGSEFVELPPATPVLRNEIGGRTLISIPAANGNGNGNGHVDVAVVQEAIASGSAIAVAASFDRDRLERTLRFLGEARFKGLVTHLFALRAFFPDAVGGDAAAALAELRETLRESLDRIYIKLRLPNYVLAPRDVETQAARDALSALIERMAPDIEPPGITGTFVLHGVCDADEVRAFARDLPGAALATALPWSVMARLIPADGEALLHYRTLLAAAFDEARDADETGFIDLLQRRPYPVLDAALDIVRAQLGVARV